MTKFEYIEYVKATLSTLDRSKCVAAYNTGFGLTIVGEYLGDTTSGLDVRVNEIARIAPPKIDDIDLWVEAWGEAKAMVLEFTGEPNEPA